MAGSQKGDDDDGVSGASQPPARPTTPATPSTSISLTLHPRQTQPAGRSGEGRNTAAPAVNTAADMPRRLGSVPSANAQLPEFIDAVLQNLVTMGSAPRANSAPRGQMTPSSSSRQPAEPQQGHQRRGDAGEPSHDAGTFEMLAQATLERTHTLFQQEIQLLHDATCILESMAPDLQGRPRLDHHGAAAAQALSSSHGNNPEPGMKVVAPPPRLQSAEGSGEGRNTAADMPRASAAMAPPRQMAGDSNRQQHQQERHAFRSYDPQKRFVGLVPVQQTQADVLRRPGSVVPSSPAMVPRPQMAAPASNQPAPSGNAPRQEFPGGAPWNLVPLGPPAPHFARVDGPRGQTTPSSSRPSAAAQPQTTGQQRGGEPRSGTASNLPDAGRGTVRTPEEAAARRAEKRPKLDQGQATMPDVQKTLRLDVHPGATATATAQALSSGVHTVTAPRTLGLPPRPQRQAAAGPMCLACDFWPAMSALYPTTHLCLCADCYNVTIDDPDTPCPVCRAHRRWSGSAAPQRQAQSGSMCRACRTFPATRVRHPTDHLCLCTMCYNANRDDPYTVCPVCRADRAPRTRRGRGRGV